MNKLSIEDRPVIDAFFDGSQQHSFYHYFPLLYAISESTDQILLNKQTLSTFIQSDSVDDMYFEPYFKAIPLNIKKVFVSLNRCTIDDWSSELYDRNFVYDLETTLKIKNFRDNAETYLKQHKLALYESASSQQALEVIARWYSISKRQKFYDFGYTKWLCENFNLFNDLHARVILDKGAPVAFSLWGELCRPEKLAIHLISKDFGHPFLQDFCRFQTYKEMLAKGFTTVNDGGDVGELGIYLYKLKLRPELIYPIYSWVKTEGK